MLSIFDHPICLSLPKRLTPYSAWHQHIPFAMWLVDILHPRVIVELGTQYGDSYCAFCQTVQELNIDAKCYAVDTWQGDPHAGFYGPEVLADLRAHHDPLYGSFSRLIQSTFDEALEHFADGTIDLLHIDGYHTYDAIKHDFESWLPKMSWRGVVLLHDINVPERDFGVKRFWEEIKKEYLYFEFLHGHGLGVLAVGSEQPEALRTLLEASGKEAANIRRFFFELGHRLALQVQQEQLTQQIAEKDRLIQTLLNQAGERERALQHLNAQLAEREQTIEELRSQVTQLTSELAAEEQTLGDLNAQLAEGKQSMEQLQRQLGQLRAEQERLSQELAEKERAVDDLSGRLVEREQTVQALQGRIQEDEEALKAMRRRLTWRRYRFADSAAGCYWYMRHPKLLLQIIKDKAWKLGRRWLPKLIKAWIKSVILRSPPSPHFSSCSEADVYQIWITQNEPTQEELRRQKEDSRSFTYQPKISIIMPVYNIEPRYLRSAINSVVNQTYHNWELCIADGNSPKAIKSILRSYTLRDPRIKVKFLSENKGISGNSNEALSLATGEFVAFVDDDDELAPFALFEVAKFLNSVPTADYIYSDEDKITENGERFGPFFKPDWSPDLILSCMYTLHLGVYRKSLVDEIGGLRPEYDGTQDYDLVLRIMGRTDCIYHIPKVLYHWRTIPGSAAHSPLSKLYAFDAQEKALADFLRRNNIKGSVIRGHRLGIFRVKREISNHPLVTIIVPTKDNPDILRKCINSILTRTEYPHFEILVIDNGSMRKETLDYFTVIMRHPKIRVLRYEKPFNFAEICNFAVEHAQGKHILFLNDDTEVISEEWLSAMLEHSQRKEVGAVGAKLYFPDGTIQHAGVVLGLGSYKGYRVAGHICYNSREEFAYGDMINVIRNWSAVTGSCMMMRKEVFNEIGGFDTNLPYSYQDIDLCMKLRQKGYLIVFTPFSKLYHYESYTRGYPDTPEKEKRFLEDIQYFLAKWGSIVQKGDPYYNPNLSLDDANFAIAIKQG